MKKHWKEVTVKSAFAISLWISFDFTKLCSSKYVLFKRLHKRAAIMYVSTHVRVSFYLSLDFPRVRSIASTAAIHSRKHLRFATSALFEERREILRAFRRSSRDPPCQILMEGSIAHPTNSLVLTREIGVETRQLPKTFADFCGFAEFKQTFRIVAIYTVKLRYDILPFSCTLKKRVYPSIY